MSLRLIVESDFEFSYSASLDEQGKCLKFEVNMEQEIIRIKKFIVAKLTYISNICKFTIRIEVYSTIRGKGFQLLPNVVFFVFRFHGCILCRRSV